MNEPVATYQSYLVRLWQDSPHAAWRASACSVQSGENVHFADLDALFLFLWEQVGRDPQDEAISCQRGAVGAPRAD
ncbi:MAG: hypothetical protein KJZ93_03020 [Caldilineaceae bacterium]|nr:hypothetical protein [Caldilineaceae bacterium]